MAATPTDLGPGRDGRTGWWRCRAVRTDRTVAWLAVVASDRRDDGEVVELLEAAARAEVGPDAVCTALLDAGGHRVTHLLPGPRGAVAAPPLWFAEIQESAARPPAVNLVAFLAADGPAADGGSAVPAGTLLDAAALADRPVVTRDQVGAVRWYPATGEVDQVYVQPQWRRRSVSLALISGASALSYARDWARLWSDGQRTELGEAMRSAAPWRGRTDELTHVAPPMTPGQGQGPAPAR